jgi:hypothetical protein
VTPTLISAFLTYTLITALTPGPNNILALSSVTAHGFRRSMRVLAGMSLGFVIIMLICAGLTFTLVTLDEGITSCYAGSAQGISCGWPGTLPAATRPAVGRRSGLSASGPAWGCSL